MKEDVLLDRLLTLASKMDTSMEYTVRPYLNRGVATIHKVSLRNVNNWIDHIRTGRIMDLEISAVMHYSNEVWRQVK